MIIKDKTNFQKTDKMKNNPKTNTKNNEMIEKKNEDQINNEKKERIRMLNKMPKNSCSMISALDMIKETKFIYKSNIWDTEFPNLTTVLKNKNM